MSKIVLYKGPDLSYHNGTVNIKAIRDAGCGRVGLRAGYGKNNVDQKYVTNALACCNLGVKVLLYWFSYAYNVAMAKAEAGYACAQAAKYWSRCPIAYDFEYDSVNYARKNGVSITKQLATDMAVAFLKEVKTRGYIPVIYTNKDYAKNYLDLNRIGAEVGQVYVWYARYTSSLPADELAKADVWQYTSSGSLSGVTGNVDMNNFYVELGGEQTDTVPAERENKCNINIQDFQKAANADGYRYQDGNKLVEDGIDGPKTQYVRKKIALKAKQVNGVWQVGSTGELVEWVQTRCNEILGTSFKVDGKYGKDTRAAVIKLQKMLNLTVDGIAGYNTLQALFYF